MNPLGDDFIEINFTGNCCVLLGNPVFAIEREIRKRISPPRKQSSGPKFQLRNPNPDFMDFLLTIRLGNPKKDLQTIPVNSELLFAN